MNNWRDVPKPPGVAELDVDERGYPIFFMIQPPPGQALDFRVMNLTNHLRCARERLCMICGRKLGYWLTFIGGPMCLKNRVFGDGPMHRACAEYSLRVCPYLTIGSMDYKNAPSGKVPNTKTDPNVILKKPKKMLLYTTREFKLINGGGGKPVFRVAPHKKLEVCDFDTSGDVEEWDEAEVLALIG